MGTDLNKLVRTKAANDAIAKAQQLGLRITSTYRTPQESVSVGGYATDDHTKGLALDVAGNWNAMDAFAKWAKASGQYRWVGWQVAGHFNHVHVSWYAPKAGNPTASKSYTIQSGDTLSEIAERFGTTVSKIQQANSSIKDADVIFAGQKISIPLS